jgi:predicted DNA-binding transcriptional regulator AlpA
MTRQGSIAGDPSDHLLLALPDVARTANCSGRHFQRLVAAGLAPEPIKLGSLVRWPKAVIEEWIRQGCPEQGEPLR